MLKIVAVGAEELTDKLVGYIFMFNKSKIN